MALRFDPVGVALGYSQQFLLAPYCSLSLLWFLFSLWLNLAVHIVRLCMSFLLASVFFLRVRWSRRGSVGLGMWVVDCSWFLILLVMFSSGFLQTVCVHFGFSCGILPPCLLFLLPEVKHLCV